MASIPTSEKFQIIKEMSQKEGNKIKISTLCEMAEVSRSGYYHYLSAESQRAQREGQDRLDFAKILEAYCAQGL